MDVNGIVIRSTDYGDKDKILNIATPDGIVTAAAKGVRTPKSKLKGFVGVLNFGEFSLSEGKTGFILNGADIKESFFNCWTDPDRYAAAMQCLEIYEKCVQKGEVLNLATLLKSLSEINYGLFYPFAEALRYGVITAADMGIDVTEGVFPADVSRIFSALMNSSAEEVLREHGRMSVKHLFGHLATGYASELGIKPGIFIKQFE